MTINLYSEGDNLGRIYEFNNGVYRMLDYPVNIRSAPNLNGNILGKLNLNSEIEILENAKNQQQIEGIEHYWYKIKYNNIIGYIWGGYIAVEAFDFEIDGNRFYIYYRASWETGRVYHYNEWRGIMKGFVLFPGDVFVYFNERRIPNTVFINILNRHKQSYPDDYWYACLIKHNSSEGRIYIDLLDYRSDTAGDFADRFIVHSDGRITYENGVIY
jgi:hypothetical protein